MVRLFIIWFAILAVPGSYAHAEQTELTVTALDHVVLQATSVGRREEARQAASKAFSARLQGVSGQEDVYAAYQAYGNALAAAGYFSEAAKTFRDGSEVEGLAVSDQISLLVSLARLGLVDRIFLRWSTKSMVRANALAETHGLEPAELLDIEFADQLLIGGQTEAANRVYTALWQAKPDMRATWFSTPQLVYAGGPSNLHYRPAIREGRVLARQESFSDFALAD